MTVYLLHFSRRYEHAGHYIGWADDLDARLDRHASGNGARLIQVITDAGIGFELARTWPGGRDEERRIKNMGGASRSCPLCGVAPRNGFTKGDGIMIGGYSVVAAVLNDVYAPQPPVTRQQVQGWHLRGTRNYEGQLRPGPVQELQKPEHSSLPRYLFDTGQWVTWYGQGVRGPHRRGWVKWVAADRRQVETVASL